MVHKREKNDRGVPQTKCDIIDFFLQYEKYDDFIFTVSAGEYELSR